MKEDHIKNNHKLCYRFIEYTANLMGIYLTHERLKLIALDRYTVQTEDEKKVKRLSDAFSFLINNRSSDVSVVFIRTVYYLLTNRRLSLEKIEYILDHYYKHYDETPHERVAKFHLALLNLRIDNRLEFSILLNNYILTKSGYYPMIIYPNERKRYKEINKKKDLSDVYSFVVNNEHFIRKTHHYEVLDKISIKTKRDIVKAIVEKKNAFEGFSVEHLYLYGSYAKDTQISTSDIDFLITFKVSDPSFEKRENMVKVRNLLREILNAHIDVMDFNHALFNLGIHEMTKIITII